MRKLSKAEKKYTSEAIGLPTIIITPFLFILMLSTVMMIYAEMTIGDVLIMTGIVGSILCVPYVINALFRLDEEDFNLGYYLLIGLPIPYIATFIVTSIVLSF